MVSLEQIVHPTQSELNFAVLLIDTQPSSLSTLPFFKRRKLVNSQLKVLKLCAANDIPVAVLEYSEFEVKDYRDFKDKTPDKLRNLVSRIPRSDFIIKGGDNGFRYTGLLWLLKQWEANALFLMGLYSSVCIRKTAETALNKGFSVFTSPEVIADSPYTYSELTPALYKANRCLLPDLNSALLLISSSSLSLQSRPA